MTSLLQSVSINGPVVFGCFWCWSRGLEDCLLSGQAACMYKVYEDLRSVCFWEVWRDCSKHMCRDRMRELPIFADFALTCVRMYARYPFTSQKQTTYISHFNQTILDGYC